MSFDLRNIIRHQNQVVLMKITSSFETLFCQQKKYDAFRQGLFHILHAVSNNAITHSLS